MTEPSDDYEVGYGKPPKGNQFAKGVSGNPGGRPKGCQNRKTTLKEILAETATYREGEKKAECTKLELLLRTIHLQVARGDIAALGLYEKLTERSEPELDGIVTGILIAPEILPVEEWQEKYNPAYAERARRKAINSELNS